MAFAFAEPALRTMRAITVFTAVTGLVLPVAAVSLSAQQSAPHSPVILSEAQRAQSKDPEGPKPATTVQAFSTKNPTLSSSPAFTLQQAMSAPVASSLTAAPKGALFAWVENAEGRRNLWVASPPEPARQLTHYTEDDGQELTQLAWSPDAKAIAYTYGAESGSSGSPANPAELQRPTAIQLIVQPLDAKAAPIAIPNARAALFLDEHTLLFLRGGSIWTADLTNPTSAHQLVYDRGSASSLTLSPDHKLLAYVSTRRQPSHPSHAFIALYDLTAHTLRFLAPSTGVDFAPSWSPDGKMLAWLRHQFRDEPEFATKRVTATPWSIQLWDFEKNEGRMVYQPEANKYGSEVSVVSSGIPYLLWATGDRILFFSENEGWIHLYSVDTRALNAKPQLLTRGDGEVEDASMSADHQTLLWSSNIGMNVFSYDGFASCMGPIAALQEADVDRRHVFSLDLSKEPPAKNPVFYDDSLHVTTGEGIETHPLQLTDGTIVALASGPFEPMHPVFIDKGKNTITEVRAGRLPKSFPQSNLVFPEAASFESERMPGSPKTLLIHAQLFTPGNTRVADGEWTPSCNRHRINPSGKIPKPRPAIIFVHGGPKRQMYLGYPDGQYYSNAYTMNQYLASRGFIVLSVNYRCGIGYGLEFRQCEDSGATGGKEYADVLAAQKYLASRPDVDPKRIGIWGGSYGGYLTALALARNSDLFAAGVDFHGVHDWILEDNRDDWLRGTNAEQDAIAAKAHASSPLADIDKWRSPVLLIQGDDDPDVAYAQTPTLAEALEAHHVPHETMVFPDEVHGFLLHKDWLAAYEAAAKFFERTLQPEK